jgi:hypothetical protein
MAKLKNVNKRFKEHCKNKKRNITTETHELVILTQTNEFIGSELFSTPEYHALAMGLKLVLRVEMIFFKEWN